MIDKLQKPGTGQVPKGQKSVSSETTGLLSELSSEHKSIRSKKRSIKNKITSVTRRAIANAERNRPKKSTGSVKHNVLEPETKIALLNLQAIPSKPSKPHIQHDIDATTLQILRGLVPLDGVGPYESAYLAVIAGTESPSSIFDKQTPWANYPINNVGELKKW